MPSEKKPGKLELAKTRFREAMLRLGLPKIAEWTALDKKALNLGADDLDELARLIEENTEPDNCRIPFWMGLIPGLAIAALVAVIFLWPLDDNGSDSGKTEATPATRSECIVDGKPFGLQTEEDCDVIRNVKAVETTPVASPESTPESLEAEYMKDWVECWSLVDKNTGEIIAQDCDPILVVTDEIKPSTAPTPEVSTSGAISTGTPVPCPYITVRVILPAPTAEVIYIE